MRVFTYPNQYAGEYLVEAIIGQKMFVTDVMTVDGRYVAHMSLAERLDSFRGTGEECAVYALDVARVPGYHALAKEPKGRYWVQRVYRWRKNAATRVIRMEVKGDRYAYARGAVGMVRVTVSPSVEGVVTKREGPRECAVQEVNGILYDVGDPHPFESVASVPEFEVYVKRRCSVLALEDLLRRTVVERVQDTVQKMTEASVKLTKLEGDVTEDQLWATFSSVGSVNSIRLMDTNLGRVAYVNYQHRAGAEAARDTLSDVDINGFRCHVAIQSTGGVRPKPRGKEKRPRGNRMKERKT